VRHWVPAAVLLELILSLKPIVADDIPNFEGRELTKSSREKCGRLRPMPFRISTVTARASIFSKTVE
jgi:hypothetical protein